VRARACSGGKFVSRDGEEASCADLLGVRLLYTGHNVDSWLRRHCMRNTDWSFFHGLLHPRRSCNLTSSVDLSEVSCNLCFDLSCMLMSK